MLANCSCPIYQTTPRQRPIQLLILGCPVPQLWSPHHALAKKVLLRQLAKPSSPLGVLSQPPGAPLSTPEYPPLLSYSTTLNLSSTILALPKNLRLVDNQYDQRHMPSSPISWTANGDEVFCLKTSVKIGARVTELEAFSLLLCRFIVFLFGICICIWWGICIPKHL